ncbi:hypothetical protein [Paenibacillus protaetiae]|uniref:Uncharacterized protein n=1 Tax=Paenibacillus protaetiae TaxID=2509456 RepID=A0A4P6EY41_9BACL|nr:hypothetical protein [Paenibacillus protaetiae]QAY68002.1 hypothetical protein ET464_18105 [Paenibacillus protaetiae]
MLSYESRRKEVIRQAAEAAWRMPLFESGLWVHQDIRDNFYYASYLFAAAADHTITCSFDRQQAADLAARVLHEVLSLQQREADKPLYGHWPLSLGDQPRKAKPHPLPVELMGSLMAYFRWKYGERMEPQLAAAFDEALRHVYLGRFYDVEMKEFNHHEAKYTAAKLIFGHWFGDQKLMTDGHACLRQTICHNREHGMTEYGALPWFWHWVQAYTAALELAADMPGTANTANMQGTSDILDDLREMLDGLWRERSYYYLKGTWVGPHSRAWPHDIPRDSNVLMDYVQFGGFPLPESMPRTEYAGFLFYKAPEDAVQTALDRTKPVQVKRKAKRTGEGFKGALAYKYVYITENYAAGGVWERFDEFDNEQQRWDFTFPLADGSEHVNQAYFFRPGAKNGIADARHQGNSEVLFHQNTIIAWYEAADGEEKKPVTGVLPLAEWILHPAAMYGCVQGVYMAIWLNRDGYQFERLEDRCVVVIESDSASAGGEVQPLKPAAVVVEAMAAEDAAKLGISGLEAFVRHMERQVPDFQDYAVEHTTSRGDRLQLAIQADGGINRQINGAAIAFEDYIV